MLVLARRVIGKIKISDRQRFRNGTDPAVSEKKIFVSYCVPENRAFGHTLIHLLAHSAHNLAIRACCNSKMQKRQYRDEEDDAEDVDVDVNVAKKLKRDSTSTALVSIAPTSQALMLSRTPAEPGRTSALMAPEVSLLGHEGAVYSIAFDPSGNHLCSGSFDKQICKFHSTMLCSAPSSSVAYINNPHLIL